MSDLHLSDDGLPIAAARLEAGAGDDDLLVIDRCPLCGARHVHSVTRTPGGYVPRVRPAGCIPTTRASWMVDHPETAPCKPTPR